ncbi:response regulator transcription factor [Burkholderia sp. MSMB1078WGS]|uniref:response regulator transcription factor n=1 Tax=Burkholderia sp. MSMB1078WGS TaxID=1637900 RepID=UPI0009E77100|nr:response regulator transcription factor [Burkholderia sp. MSMB1078WGS]
MKILVAEDDPIFVDFMTRVLSEKGHEIIVAVDGLAAVRYMEKSLADLVILDWTLPHISGIDVLRWIRKNMGYKIPVMFLTNRVFENFISEALDAGADEYVAKPIGERQLLSRINVIERRLRSSTNVPMVIEVGNFRIDNCEKSVSLNGSRVPLNPKEFELAYALFANYGCIVPRNHLAIMIWGRPEDAFFRPLDSAIYRIRSKLGLDMRNGVALKSVYKIGYRLDVG